MRDGGEGQRDELGGAPDSGEMGEMGWKSESEVRRLEQAGDAPVRGFLHVPGSPSGDALVLSHGAGSNCAAPLLVALANAFCDAGLHVLRCDLPFRQLHPHGPPPRGSAEKDREGLRQAVNSCASRSTGASILVGIRMAGGRVRFWLRHIRSSSRRFCFLRIRFIRPNGRSSYGPTTSQVCGPSALRAGNPRRIWIDRGAYGIDEAHPAATELLPVTGAGHDLLTGRNRETLIPTVVNSFRTFAQRSIAPAVS